MNFEELEPSTRKWMLEEFEIEEKNNPYRSSRLNSTGKKEFYTLMKKAITEGNILSLSSNLSSSNLWNSTELVTRKNTSYDKKIDPVSSANLLAHTEFTTWYTTGFARRLMEEKIDECEIYRAEQARQPRSTCSCLEGKHVKVKSVYDGHRVPYHNKKENPDSISIPSGPYCHHTIRRIKK